MDATEWAEFNAVLSAVLKRLEIKVERHEPGAIVIRGRGTFGLANIAQLCHANPRADWPQILMQHFTTALATRSADDLLDRGRLRVRLFPDEYFTSETRSNMITRAYATGITAGVVLDLPERVQLIPRRQLDLAQLDEDAMWDIAWASTRASERPDEHEVLTFRGAAVHSLFGESFFVASLVQFLPDVIGPIGIRGALVSVPHRHSLLAHVIDDGSLVHALRAMLPLTRKLFAAGPGSVSAHLYLWNDGESRCLSSIGNDPPMELHRPDYSIARLSE